MTRDVHHRDPGALPDPAEDELALAALAATHRPRSRPDTPCPPDGELAAFIDGALKPQAAAAVRTHVDQCADCYAHWVEVSAALAGAAVDVAVAVAATPAPTAEPHPPSRFRLRGLWSGWLPRWEMAVPALAAAAVAAVLIVPRLAPPALDAQLDVAYAEAGPADLGDVAWPWQGAPLAFASDDGPAARRAFGAGLWQGRAALTAAHGEPPAAWLESEDWQTSQVAEHYALGRWWALALASTADASLAGGGATPKAVANMAGALRQRLAAGGQADRQPALRELDALLPLLDAGGSALRRRLVIGMAVLAS